MFRPLLIGSALLVTLAALLGIADTAQAQKKKKAGLPGTTWKGSETLAGYGDLTFKFKAGGQVTMIDAKESVDGEFTRDGRDVKLTFFQGNVVYTGAIDGKKMSGTARNAEQKAWTWNVTLQKKKGKD